ncbi:MAG: phosphoglycerate dehydrogenase [Pseudomonadales bacterium]
MQKILTLNQIAVKGLERFPRDGFEVGTEITDPDAILVRSHLLTSEHITPSLRAVARAGAGVNNIPVPQFTRDGIVVFNTPGANANSVKELVLAAMLLCARGIAPGIEFVRGLEGITEHDSLSDAVEREKRRYRGRELAGKTLGVVGLGAIGSLVAQASLALGMEVLGYDPALSVEAAWRLSNEVKRMDNLYSLFGRSDYITIHVPLLDSTQHLINAESLKSFKQGAVLLNFSRQEVVDPVALKAAIGDATVARYFSDFPTPELLSLEEVSFTPHLGASTAEAEENCAVMAADQLIDFLSNGNIRNSVNFPSVMLERAPGNGPALRRIAVTNANVPRMLGQVMSALADRDINVVDMLNRSRDDVAYNLIDIEGVPTRELLKAINDIDGVINVRTFD